MNAPKKVSLEPSADRALAVLETAGGKSRVKQCLASMAALNGAPELSVDDLVAALKELQRRRL